jgi:hypothetical protein
MNYLSQSVIALMLLFNTSAQAHAEDISHLNHPDSLGLPACNDAFGIAVEYIEMDDVIDSIPMVRAMGARYLDSDMFQRPAIIYDKNFVLQLSTLGARFAFGHECYHLASPHAVEAYTNRRNNIRISRDADFAIEAEADCGAINVLINQFDYTADDLSTISEVFELSMSTTKAQRRTVAALSCLNANHSLTAQLN